MIVGEMRRDGEFTRSETMAASAEEMVASCEASRREAYFVEVCLANEPHDAHNLMRDILNRVYIDKQFRIIS